MRPAGALEPVLSRLTLPPAVTDVAEVPRAMVGPRAVTVIVVLALLLWPTESVTVSVTTKLPLPLPNVATAAVAALVAVVKVSATDPGGRVLLVDRLPAGFEIDNPRLVDSGDVAALDWLKTTVQPEHSEFRDDRFVAAFDLWGSESSDSSSSESDGNSDDQTADDDSAEDTDAAKTTAEKPPAATATVAYIVRAVTPGSFVHPAATIEDMYRPERYARSGAGTLVVKPKS